MAAAPVQRIPIPCSKPGCRCVAGYIVVSEGKLAVEITSRHNGERHQVLLTLGEVAAMVSKTDMSTRG